VENPRDSLGILKIHILSLDGREQEKAFSLGSAGGLYPKEGVRLRCVT